MKLQIVYSEDGWILSTLARYLIDNIDGAVGSVDIPDVSRTWDITYYVNYYLFRPGRLQRIVPVAPATKNSLVSGAWFTHKDKYHYESKARILDFCICPCTITARYLKRFNKRTFVAYHGIDTGKFTPKIRMGFVGKVKNDNRKGQDFFDTVRSLPFVELRVTGGNLPADEIPSFYHDIDYVFIPSVAEGGPLCFQEGLASGKEILSTDVGMVHDFVGKEGIHIFDRNNPQTLIDLLNRLYEKRLKLRSVVEEYTIDFFVKRHLEIFGEMLERKRQ
ncbi:MAG: glycosyltransferase family 4 protein [Chitinispirillaceae bacterium]|nr:glycosyltransferase family 4 protein [Chitinispirillaceae bacterium]